MPIDLPDEPALRAALASAVRAPSIYNSQPWRWRASITDGVDLFADPDRHLIAIDLDGRDLLLSCGAALHHLVVALAGLGWSARVERLPDPENSDHLARLHPVTASPAPGTAALAAAIVRRRTDRRRFSARPVGEDLLAAFSEYAAGGDVELHIVADAAPHRLIEIWPHRRACSDSSWALAGPELANGPVATGAGDGIESGTVTSGMDRPGEVPMRDHFRMPGWPSPRKLRHDDASALMVLATGRDDRLAALRAAGRRRAPCCSPPPTWCARPRWASRWKCRRPGHRSVSTSSDRSCGRNWCCGWAGRNPVPRPAAHPPARLEHVLLHKR